MIVFPVEPGPEPSGPGVVGGWKVTGYFGGRIDPLTGQPGKHSGMDLAHSGCAGQPIRAPVDGIVRQAWDSSGGGWWTRIDADDGSSWGLGHAQRFAEGVNGRRVAAGTVVAYVGSSGRSTGAHLHLAFRPGGASGYSDPYDLLVAAAGAISDGNVRLAQELLNGLGYNSGAPDGQWGPTTKAAVEAFQRDYGLVVDGLIGPQVNGVLAAVYHPDAGIKMTQELIRGLGYSLGRTGANGVVTPGTVAALKAFQADHGLAVTGVIDEATNAAVASAYRPVVQPVDVAAVRARIVEAQVALEAAITELGG